MKRLFLDNIKNVPGWRTDEKLVVLSVDDYGAVRQDSAISRDRLRQAGLDSTNRFDEYDAVETREDLEALFEVLSSVEDRDGNNAVVTAYALCANPDFSSIRQEEGEYRYETLPQTFDRLEEAHGAVYAGGWQLWRDGVNNGILRPQFHGREHLNVEMFERKLKAGDQTLALNLDNRSLVGIQGDRTMPGVGFTHAFGIWEEAELARHREILRDGLSLFEDIFGFRSITFTPPAQKLHSSLFSYACELDVRAIDKPFFCARRLDKESSKREINWLGRSGNSISLVRNVVFEPTADRNFDSVKLALDQISAAFRWRRPAIISSHRVNFAGHIDRANRDFGLESLKRLLWSIVKRWPDVRFIAADELVQIIEGTLE